MTYKEIIKYIAESEGLRPSDLYFKTNRIKYVLPRQIAIVLASDYLKLTSPQLLQEFGMHRSGVYNARKKVYDRMDTDISFRKKMSRYSLHIKECIENEAKPSAIRAFRKFGDTEIEVIDNGEGYTIVSRQELTVKAINFTYAGLQAIMECYNELNQNKLI